PDGNIYAIENTIIDNFATGIMVNKYSLEKAVDAIKQESRHYAKRQITWFRRNEKIKWINVLGK
ncbi:MAG: hypothetical protein RSA27_07140, partial [Oscillospiraceae bacterium]